MLIRHLTTTAIIAMLLGSAAWAQKATEMFIPIGQSPGLSGTYTVIGEVTGIDAEIHTGTIRDEEGDHPAKITAETKIWLDRSALGLPNQPGTSDDLIVGSRCEVMYVYDGETRQEEARWIKVQVDKAE